MQHRLSADPCTNIDIDPLIKIGVAFPGMNRYNHR